MPTFNHAFKNNLSPFSERVAMCEALGMDLGSWAKTCTIEESLPSPSFSIDSLRALQALHPEHQFRFVVGADILPERHRWKEWSVIERDFCPIVVGRDGYENPVDTIVFPEPTSPCRSLFIQTFIFMSV